MFFPMNYLVRKYLRKWDQEIESVKRDCWAVQQQQFSEILNSKYVKYLNPHISQYATYDEIKNKLPLQTYTDLSERIETLKNDKPLLCKYFAQSSGTTSGTKKLIPTPDEFVRKNLLRGSWYILHTLYQHNSNMSVFKSKNLLIGGSIYKKSKKQVIADVSGIMLSRIPRFFRPWYVPSIATAIHSDWQYKIEKTATAAAKTYDITLLGGLPTWVLSTCKLILEKSGKNKLSDLWPNLQAYIHGGVSFQPYKSQFEELIDIPDFRFIEVYNASEGFFAYQDRPDEDGMLLMCASGIFFEFIDISDFQNGNFDVKTIDKVRAGVSYVILISTISGLLRYLQGDIVTFVSVNPYRIKVSGRVGEFINAFGEDLVLAHAEEALMKNADLFEFKIHNYTIAPSYLSLHEKGFHQWFIEFENTPKDIHEFARSLDISLREINSNYDQKRVNNLALDALKIVNLPKGTTDVYFKKHASLGGQNKLPKLRNDRVIAERMITIIKSMDNTT